jgi:hypothetical protein
MGSACTYIKDIDRQQVLAFVYILECIAAWQYDSLGNITQSSRVITC